MNIFNPVITDVLNPLQIKKNSVFSLKLGEHQFFKFKKIIEMTSGNIKFSRYIIYNIADHSIEYVLEAFPIHHSNSVEVRLFTLDDTIPFSEEFLYEVAGRPFITVEDDNGESIEYARCQVSDEDWLDGNHVHTKVYNVLTDKIEESHGFKSWDYELDDNGIIKSLNVEMSEEDGMFRMFTGEIIESVFYDIT
jgi:hypothetical protein